MAVLTPPISRRLGPTRMPSLLLAIAAATAVPVLLAAVVAAIGPSLAPAAPVNPLPPVTGYDYEPSHYRYLGRDVAAAVHGSGLPLRQYLWELER
jgi:hypothetical protein